MKDTCWTAISYTLCVSSVVDLIMHELFFQTVNGHKHLTHPFIYWLCRAFQRIGVKFVAFSKIRWFSFWFFFSISILWVAVDVIFCAIVEMIDWWDGIFTMWMCVCASGTNALTITYTDSLLCGRRQFKKRKKSNTLSFRFVPFRRNIQFDCCFLLYVLDV